MATITLPGAEPGATVALNGVGSGSWSQTAGPAVALTGTGANRTFVAPITLAGVELRFGFAGDVHVVPVLAATERVVQGGVERPALMILGGEGTPTATPVLTVAAVPGDALVDVTWSLTGATAASFLVTRTGPAPGNSFTDPGSATSRRFTGLTNNQAVTVTVTATLPNGATVTGTATATPVAAPPVAVPVLNVTATPGDGQVALAWSVTDGQATGYVVGRDGTDTTGGGPWSTSEPATAASRLFDKLVNNQTYTLTVSATLSTGAVLTKSVTATPTAPIIPTLTVTAIGGNGFVDVGWSLANATATSWSVRRLGGAATTEAANVTTKRYSGLTNSQAYTFEVVANLASGGTLTKTATGTPTAGTTPGPNPSGRVIPLVGASGLPFNSIVFDGSGSPSNANAFGTQRGRAMDGLMWFTPRGTWAELRIGLDSAKAAWLAAGRLLVTTIPHAPQGLGTVINQQGANNAYAAEQQAYGGFLAANGFNSPLHVIRLDWEANGNWYAWSAEKPGGASALRQAIINCITNLRAGGATQVKFDLCWNKGPSQAGADFSFFPGRQYVDVVGVDQYDQWAPSFSTAQWSTEIARTPALATLRDFAAANEVMWSLDEGGNTHPADGNHGGDNPFYWQRVWEFFSGNASRCAWHVTYTHPGAPESLKHDFPSNPNSWAYYRTTFGGA